MAPMDGWETLVRIKTNPQTSPVPVIMISGKSLDGNEQEKYGAMFYQYLMKPLRRIELCDAVRRALDSG
jgi:CheY-like chemotaxis protein